MTDLTSLRDRLLTRCLFCGQWRYGQQPCTACGDTRTPALDDSPRRPNVGRRSA